MTAYFTSPPPLLWWNIQPLLYCSCWAFRWVSHLINTQYVTGVGGSHLETLMGHTNLDCVQADMCPRSAQLEVLSFTAETDLSLFLHLYTKHRPPFINAKPWPKLVTHWGCTCHLGHTLCQLKLFYISWMTDSSLIVLLFFFSLHVRKYRLERGNAWPLLLLCLERKMRNPYRACVLG